MQLNGCARRGGGGDMKHKWGWNVVHSYLSAVLRFTAGCPWAICVCLTSLSMRSCLSQKLNVVQKWDSHPLWVVRPRRLCDVNTNIICAVIYQTATLYITNYTPNTYAVSTFFCLLAQLHGAVLYLRCSRISNRGMAGFWPPAEGGECLRKRITNHLFIHMYEWRRMY